MKSKAAAFLAAIAGILATGALLAPGAQAGSIAGNVNVSLAGSGTGKVTSTGTTGPQEINCPGVCTTSFPAGSSATLTATAASGSVFVGWTGVTCNGGNSATTCVFNTGAGINNVTATFNLATPTDSDGDGVPDASDNCPTLPGPADNQGCPKYNPPAPIPGNPACDKATTKLAKAQEKLAELKKDDASDEKIDAAKQKVKKAKKAKKKACAT